MMKISNPTREILLKSRILFTMDGCSHCRHYMRFIQTINAKLPYNKRIAVINCSNYHDYGIVEDQRIKIFIEHYKGSYPSLFIDGTLVSGSNSREELYAWLMSRLDLDFITNEDTERFMFNMQCRFTKKNRKGLICQ